MSGNYSILLWQQEPSPIKSALSDAFAVELSGNLKDALAFVRKGEYKALLVDSSVEFASQKKLLEELRDATDTNQKPLPVVLVGGEISLEQKLQLFNVGCDDYLAEGTPASEVIARLNKAIFHRIANEQLFSQLKVANEMAFMAMSDTSDLGINIQFLLESANCSNLDELGQLLFQSLKSYGLNGSLQMRGKYEVKNMEANGLAKDLEAQLLTELKDSGRYYDFGARTVMNYDQVSVLIRNMPLDDEKKYGAVKDNVFSLLQGTDARVKALDNIRTMDNERELLELMTRKMQAIFPDVEASYRVLVRNIADVVEDMAEKIEASVMTLGLTENQEKILEAIMADGIARTHEIFSNGLRLDDELEGLVNQVNTVFDYKDRPDFYRYLVKIRDSLR